MTAPPRVKRDCQCPVARHEHGTVAAYNADSCRCEPCTLARRRHAKRWRRNYDLRAQAGQPVGLVPGCGTQRRLQALAAIGWSTTRLGAELGVAQQRISELQHTDCRATATLAARVATLYDRLWNIHPGWAGSERTRRDAARKGWQQPMVWDDNIDDPAAKPWRPKYAARIDTSIDHIAVERRIAGDRVRLTRHELAAAVYELTDRGWPLTQVCERLRMSGARATEILDRRDQDTAA